jgi:TnpA family transposase
LPVERKLQSFSGWIAIQPGYGKRGELRQSYREGQKDQLGALGLVLNVLVLWNTWYLDQAL